MRQLIRIYSNVNNPNSSKLVYPELSYKIVGILFEVHKKLGNQFEEKYYQRAIEKLLVKNKLHFTKELRVDITFENDKIGKYFLDFLIEGKIILELKTVPMFLPIRFRQIRSYLKVKNLELGILANFRPTSLVYRRILNNIRINLDNFNSG